MDVDSGLDVLSNDGMLDIISPNEYDPFEAKFCASLFWLVFHATEDGGLEDVPSQVTSPIQKLDKDGFVVHPEIVQFLTKGEVYCTVCTRIFPGKVALAGHWSVIQTLSRNGIYVVDGSTDVAVTDSSLEQTNPFHQSAHIALMDALMTAYSSQVVNIQSVVQAVRRFSTFSASRELPFDLEDALLLWVNKLSTALNAKYSQTASSGSRKLLRNREQEKKMELRMDQPEVTSSAKFPVIDDLLKGLCDGRCLLGILLFYEPTVMKIEDICFPRVESTDDSIRNLDLFRSLCSQYFCTSVLALKVEDILYGSPTLKINIVALLAEMFSKCEGNSKQTPEIQRSKTSCSENGIRDINGHDESTRSHSAPVTGNVQFRDKDITLKIQNFVENVGSLEEDVPSGSKQIPGENGMKMDSTTSEDTLDDLPEDEETMEVQGVIVKLRKKVPRNVQPGGGHEALLSRRMKKSLCSWSQEDISTETNPETSEPEDFDQFDAKSEELYQKSNPGSANLLNEGNEAAFKAVGNVGTENVDSTSLKDTTHPLDLNLNTLPDAVTPVDLLSPISETTEPGSLGNSFNGAMTSPRDFHSPIGGPPSVLRHQVNEKTIETTRKPLTPPVSQTPRNVKDENQSSIDESLVPRGSYVINNVYHTAESAVAAGLPVVERESQTKLGQFQRNLLTSSARSGDNATLFRSSFADVQVGKARNNGEMSGMLSGSDVTFSEKKNGVHEHAVTDEQWSVSGNAWSERRNNNRFSTFTKNKNNSKEDLRYSHSTTKDRTDITIRKSAEEKLAKPKTDKTNSGPPITWFVHQEKDLSPQKDTISGNLECVSHVSQRALLNSGCKTTNWAMTAEAERCLGSTKKGSSQSTDNKDSVSLELNLLRLKLAEKQRHIEAQKQRTREQLEEERKRFGQNVFWFAVGKEKEKKEQNGIKSPKEVESKGSVEKPQSSVYRKSSSEVESLQNNKFDAFTKQSSLEEELPPSMGKLQDRTYSLKTIDESLTASNGDLSTRAEPTVILPNQPPSRKGKNIESQVDDLNSNRNTTGEVIHEFRLSRQASKSQDPLLSKAQMTSRPDIRGNSGDFATQPEKRRAPVVNYKSRISVPLTYSTKPVFESSSNENGSGNDMNPVDVTAAVENEDPNQASSPTRKRWDIDSACQAGPQLAVSKSNYGIFGKDSCSGMANTDDNRQAMSENVQESRRINQQAFGDLGIPGKTDNALEKDIPGDTRSPASSDEQTDLNKKMNSEKVYYAQTGNGSDGRPESASLEANGNSPDSEDGSETPKKGLALFIGDQNAVAENGLTPEQLRKRERFLKNRQQKLEEEKMKKEAILEKKRRKEEKMKEIQLRREKEELSRQARLQEKREQAEIAKQERQRYELHRKENLPRSNVVDGISSGYRGLTRTEMNQHASSSVTNGGTPFRMNGPLSTPPSAFSGFTGVESYVKPSGKTNRKLIINAISHVCLPGAVNKETKDRCLQAMTESSAQHFLILFREGLKFRGLYSLDPESNQVLKVHGVGPRSVTEKMIQRLYKYNSGGKEFSELPAKGFSLSVDGFTLQKSCWQSNKPSVASKTVSNYKLSYHKPAR